MFINDAADLDTLFQFHKGTIRTGIDLWIICHIDISIP